MSAPAEQPPGKRLVLHIGFHETGTMVIQESLFGFRVKLRDHGVVYPQPLSGHQSHLDLATALGFNPRLGELSELNSEGVIERYRRLVEDSPDGSTVVLSSEELCLGNFRPFAMDRLRVFLDKLDVHTTVVAYGRDPVEFLLAVYHHELRDTLSTARFGEWLQHFDMTGADFERRLDPWRALVDESAPGAAELRIRDYDALRASGTPLLADFLATASLGEIEMLSIEHPVSEIHPTLVDALIATRRAELDPDRTRRHLEHLLEISSLMPPVDAAAVHLGPAGAAELAERFGDVGRAAALDRHPDHSPPPEPQTEGQAIE